MWLDLQGLGLEALASCLLHGTIRIFRLAAFLEPFCPQVRAEGLLAVSQAEERAVTGCLKRSKSQPQFLLKRLRTEFLSDIMDKTDVR